MRLRSALVATLACAAVASLSTPAFGQTAYTWNNTGTDPTAAASWSPGSGPPGAADSIHFNVLGTFGTSTLNNPVLNVAAGGTIISASNTAAFQGWTLTGTGNFTTTAPTATNSLTTSGVGTTTINGPTLAGAAAVTNLLSLNVGTSSTLLLAGSTAVTANQGNINVLGGTLRLDNSGTNIAARLLSTGTVTINGGGTLELIGNASASTTTNLGTLNAGSNVVGGVNVIKITPNGQTTSLNFANAAAGFSTRPGTRGVYEFVATSGNLGDSSGAKVTFVGSPFLGANGLLSNSAGGGTVGYAVVSDSLGRNFATWTASTGVINVANPNSGQTVSTVTNAAGLQGLTSTNIGQLNIAASTTLTPTALTSGSLRITPGGSGATLAMGTNALTTNALMLDGANDFTISGTGNLGGTGTRYIYVNSANVTLSTSIVVANGTNPTVFAGPGFVDLTGTASQNSLGTTNRFAIGGGVVRGNNTQIGFSSIGAGVVSLSGGVLEIKNGLNGSGTSADFTRPITAGASAAGSVTWGAQNAAEIGSGGFSAFGADASVNIGGVASPTALTWNQRNFVGDGFALKFGSTQSNATLRWQNPIALDSGTPGNYLIREINVTKGAGNLADQTLMTGIISGSTSTDLLKTGTGVLELIGQNNYRGNTLIHAGTLVVGSSGSLGDTTLGETGNVVVGNGAALAGVGNIRLTAGKSVIVNPGGTIRTGMPVGTTGPDHVGTLNVSGGNVTLNGTSTDRPTLQFEADRTSSTTANVSKLDLNGGTLNLNPGSGNQFVIDLAKTTTTAAVGYNETYTVTIATDGAFQLNGVPLGDGVISQSNYVLTSSAYAFDPGYTLSVTGTDLVLVFTPVPEPSTVLGIAAGVLGVGALVRRRLRARTALAA